MKDQSIRAVPVFFQRTRWPRFLTLFFAGLILLLHLLKPTNAESAMIGINVVLNQPPHDSILLDLSMYGQVLDVIPEINAVTLRAQASQLSTIQALSYVEEANQDTKAELGSEQDLSDGANHWSLDAINVTDFGTTRTVGYDGEGVLIGVIDTGLAYNWRSYFPEERIDVIHARGFGGGGGNQGTVSEQPNSWEHDTTSHGTQVTSIILGFRYTLTDPVLPASFNGVAPKARVIPVNVAHNNQFFWFSVAARAIVYLTNLKIDGSLGDAPLVINMSWGAFQDDVLVRAAIDYAIANGVIAVAVAGNGANAGMWFPGRYEPVISAAATGWVGEFPPDDPTFIEWLLRDVPESDISQHFIAPFSSFELSGQDLDVAAPGFIVAAASTQDGREDYTFFSGTSAATPHVSGVAALMLQKNPDLTQAQIEDIVENTAFSLPPGCRFITIPSLGPGRIATWGSQAGSKIILFQAPICWNANATGAGLIQADAALAATP